MLFKYIFLCCVFIICESAYEGDQCAKDGRTGTCVVIGKCKSAIEDIRNNRRPQICGFNDAMPIVCCIDNQAAPLPVATTTRRPAHVTTTTEYVPPVYDYTDLTDRNGKCPPVDPTLTSKKTGQRAFDKCIEYQEQLVYPCERGPGLAATGDMSRGKHCYHNADDLIIGGVAATKNEFPHMVMLGYGDDVSNLAWLCGGALISDRYILTAGHCVASREQGDVSHVLVGALLRSETSNSSKVYKVKSIIRHPGYQPPSKYNDIALLQTEKKISLSQFVVPACLHVGDAVVDDRVLATGWGLTEYKGTVSEVMQKVILHKFTTQECAEKYPENRNMKIGFDPNTQVCYGDRTQAKDTCQGDSGGPIQIKSRKVNCMYILVGVTSFGRACGFPGEPAIYTRVQGYLSWIENIVWP